MIGIVVLLVFQNLFAKAFHTEICDHGNVTEMFTDLQECLEDQSDWDDDDICYGFKHNLQCSEKNLPRCFSDDLTVKLLSVERLLMLKKDMLKAFYDKRFQKLEKIDEESANGAATLISNCFNFTNYVVVPKLIIGLDYVETENDCKTGHIERTNEEAVKCILDGTNKFQTAMIKASQSPFRRFRSTHSIICSGLSDTVGQCLKNPLRKCLSEEEKDFFRKYLRHRIKNIMIMAEDLGSAKTLSLHTCSFLSSSRNILPTVLLISISLGCALYTCN